MPVINHLTGLRTACAESQTVYDVIQPAFKQSQHIFARNALGMLGRLKIFAELPLQHPVSPLSLLLLAELEAIFPYLAAAARAMLAGYGSALGNGAFFTITAAALQKQLLILSAALTADGVCISSHNLYILLSFILFCAWEDGSRYEGWV